MAISLKFLIPLLSNDKDSIRAVTIKIIGDTLLYLIKEDIYTDDRLPLFKYIEKRIFDSSISCRNNAYSVIIDLGKQILKILTVGQTVDLFEEIISTVTDEKPSIRKLALASIGKLTELLNDVLYVGKPD